MNNCDPCGKKRCKDPCGCAEPVLSIDTVSDNPTVLRFNINGKTVYYDFGQLVKDAETCTSLVPDTVGRTLNFHGECGDYEITHDELGSVLHLSDLGDVNADTIEDYGILSFRKASNCGEGCEGPEGGWVGENLIDLGASSLDYVAGSDGNGKLTTLMPPANTSEHYYLSWAAQNKASWKKISEFASAPVDSNGKAWRVYVDPATGELGYVKENP